MMSKLVKHFVTAKLKIEIIGAKWKQGN